MTSVSVVNGSAQSFLERFKQFKAKSRRSSDCQLRGSSAFVLRNAVFSVCVFRMPYSTAGDYCT